MATVRFLRLRCCWSHSALLQVMAGSRLWAILRRNAVNLGHKPMKLIKYLPDNQPGA